MTVHVVMPVYNRADITLSCLSCLAVQTYKDFRVVVVDDGSTDGTADRISERYPWVEVLSGDGNLWWTGAMAWGVEHVLNTAAPDDFIMSLNDDVTVDKDFLGNLVDAAVKNGRAIAGSFSRYSDSGVYEADGGYLKWKAFKSVNYRPRYLDARDVPDVLKDLDYILGHGTLIPVEVFKKVGNFNARDLPHYGGDTEFTYRAGRAGFRLVISSEAVVHVNIKDKRYTGTPSVDTWYVPFSYALRLLVSKKSSVQLGMLYTLIDLTCPRGYRFLNKLQETARSLSVSLGRTIPFAAARRVARYWFKPLPIPSYEFERRDAETGELMDDGLLGKVYFMGKEYFYFTSKIASTERGDKSAALQEIYRSSFMLHKKLEWLLFAFRRNA